MESFDPEPRLITPISRLVVQITRRLADFEILMCECPLGAEEPDLKNLCGVITAEMQQESLCSFLMILSLFLPFFLS